MARKFNPALTSEQAKVYVTVSGLITLCMCVCVCVCTYVWLGIPEAPLDLGSLKFSVVLCACLTPDTSVHLVANLYIKGVGYMYRK